MSDQLVAQNATSSSYNKHNRRTSMPSSGLELATIANKRHQTYTFYGRPLKLVESFIFGKYKTIRNKRRGRKYIWLTYLIEKTITVEMVT